MDRDQSDHADASGTPRETGGSAAGDTVKAVGMIGREAASLAFRGSENVLSACCSLLVPGLGQLIQGRPGMAVAFLLFGLALWAVCFGWVIHILAALEALIWTRKTSGEGS